MLRALTFWPLLFLGSPLADDLGFTQGLKPLVIAQAPGAVQNLSAAACASCHTEIFEAWKTTRHAQAYSNDIFQDGYLHEHQPRCLNCHAPLREQVLDARSGRDYLPAHQNQDVTDDVLGLGSLAHEGITCAVCHVRDGAVLTAKVSGRAPHAVKEEPRLNTPELCKSCHQFNFDARINGQLVLEPQLMQTTYSEWQSYRDQGGTQTCQSCHMPNGAHTFRGSHDVDLLKRSLGVQAERKHSQLTLTLRSINVGHHFPTGDVFRHLTVEVAQGNGTFEQVAWLGRTFQSEFNPALGRARKRLLKNTSLTPNQPREVVASCAGACRWRVRYHYIAQEHVERFVGQSVTSVVLAQGRL